jgi:hypothetical protein
VTEGERARVRNETDLMGPPSPANLREKTPRPDFQKSRSKASALAMTTQGVVKRWEIWGQRERPEAQKPLWVLKPPCTTQ